MKILIVTELASFHSARWINQLADTGWDVHVFQAMASSESVNEELGFGILHIPKKTRISKNLQYHLTFPEDIETQTYLNKIAEIYPDIYQAFHENYLYHLIEKIQPDVIHSLGLNINWNNLCIVVLRVFKNYNLTHRPAWLYSTWGTDLEFFPTLSAENRKSVQEVLINCDYLVTECQRDLKLAKSMGFQGESLGFLTGFGGMLKNITEEFAKSKKTANRKTIILKGRDISSGDPVGRAMTALKAFKECESLLKDYRIVIFAAAGSKSIQEEVAYLKATTNLNIQILPHLPYDLVLKIYKESILFISLTINDGIPSSLLEAMSLGVIPIYSKLEPIEELIDNEKNGILVNPENVEEVVFAIKKLLLNPSLLDEAAEINHSIITNRFSYDFIKEKAIQMYLEIKNNNNKNKCLITKKNNDQLILMTKLIDKYLITKNTSYLILIINLVKYKKNIFLLKLFKIIKKNGLHKSKLLIYSFSLIYKVINIFIKILINIKKIFSL